MATKHQVYVCCHIIIDTYLREGNTPVTVEQMAKEAVPFGGRWGVTYKELLDMLKTPMFQVLR